MEKDKAIKFTDLSQELQAQIKQSKPDVKDDTMFSNDEVLTYRLHAIEANLTKDNDETKKLDDEIIKSIKNQEFISDQLPSDSKLTLGQRVADTIAKFGGSWTFIITFTLGIIFWIILNSVLLIQGAFDPYPFILLNLVLSCLAAIQAPIIMMSQNRQEERDREQSKNDYKVNLKSEIEIRLLHEKVNHLIYDQMRYLKDIQEIQISLLKEINSEVKK